MVAPRLRQEVTLGGDLRVVQLRRFDDADKLLWSSAWRARRLVGAQVPR